MSHYDLAEWCYGWVPVGAIDGSNASFTLRSVPLFDSLALFQNGIRLVRGLDYWTSGSTITMRTAPASGDSLVADYAESVPGSSAPGDAPTTATTTEVGGGITALTGDVTASGSGSVAATVLSASTSFRLTGVISPPQITSSQNDYAPTGHADVTTFRLDTDSAWAITGLQGGVEGRIIIIHYVGANAVRLSHESGSSSAANRFYNLGAATVALQPNESMAYRYDGTTQRWRQFSNAGLLSVTGGGTGFSAYTAGDLLYAASATSLGVIGIGASGTVLGSNGSVPGWASRQPMHVALYRTTADTTSAGTDPHASTLAKTNLGTSYVIMGAVAMVTMTGFVTVRVNARVGNAAAQSGTISVELYNITDAASLVTATTTSVGLTNITASAAVALSGMKGVVARVKSSNAGDDPVFNYIGMELL